jgi:hypothetical protein
VCGNKKRRDWRNLLPPPTHGEGRDDDDEDEEKEEKEEKEEGGWERPP